MLYSENRRAETVRLFGCREGLPCDQGAVASWNRLWTLAFARATIDLTKTGLHFERRVWWEKSDGEENSGRRGRSGRRLYRGAYGVGRRGRDLYRHVAGACR